MQRLSPAQENEEDRIGIAKAGEVEKVFIMAERE